MKIIDPGLFQQYPRLPREKAAEREARDVDQELADAVRRRRKQAGNGFDADMAATAWIAADDMNTAPTIRKTESSSCQSVEKWKK